MKTLPLFVLLLCLPHLAEAQVDFSMLDDVYPGEDQGWLPTLYAPYQAETVQWEFPLFPNEADMIRSRVIIQSGPLSIIFNNYRSDYAALGKGEYPLMQRPQEDYMHVLFKIQVDPNQQKGECLP